MDHSVAFLYKSFSLTHVQYLKSDHFGGFLFSLVTLIPIFLIVSYVTLLLFFTIVIIYGEGKHSVDVFRWFRWIGFVFVGQLANVTFCSGLEAFNFALKAIIQEPRPKTPVTQGKTSYGMPSSHSQFMWYLVGFLLILIPSKMNAMSKQQKRLCLFLLFGFTAGAIAVSYSRLYLGYHTLLQIFAGSFIGFIFGAAYGYLFLKFVSKKMKEL